MTIDNHTETEYGIYIIESLKKDDPKDGEILSQILNVCRIKNFYHPIKTQEDLQEALSKFKLSKFRYLHLSFHGNNSEFYLSNGTIIKNSEFSELLGTDFIKRRIFMSSCKTGNFELASKLITKNQLFSLVGSPINIRFDKASLFFPTFYHLMNELDNSKIGKDVLKKSLKSCVDLFQIQINYYAFLRKNGIWNKKFIREYTYSPNKKAINKKRKVRMN